jgi:hypothetical protein
MERLTDSQKREVEKNIGLVGFFTSRLQSRFEPGDLDDLRQEIALGLMQAVQEKEKLPCSLSTAVHWKSRAAAWRIKERRCMLQGNRATRPAVVSTSAPVGEDDGTTIGDTLPDRGTLPDKLAACREQLRGLHPKTDIERRVLLGRAQGERFSDIAEDLGCSGTWARHILRQVAGSARAQ